MNLSRYLNDRAPCPPKTGKGQFMESVFETILARAIVPAFDLLPENMRSPEAVRMLLAIGMQESRFKYRAQVVKGQPYVKGPARGYWQFEAGGGVRGVMRHEDTRDLARAVCEARGVEFDEATIHAKLETDDVLAAAFARLLLFADSRPLPALTCECDASWDCYVRNWRPGKPHRETWNEFDDAASCLVSA